MLRFDRFFCVLFCFVLFCCCGCVFVSCNCCLVHALHALSPLREQYLTQAELNPRIRALPTENRGGLDFLYHRTRYVLSHPCCALWFTFWDDVWENNNKMAVFKDLGKDFDPRYGAALLRCGAIEVHALHTHVCIARARSCVVFVVVLWFLISPRVQRKVVLLGASLMMCVSCFNPQPSTFLTPFWLVCCPLFPAFVSPFVLLSFRCVCMCVCVCPRCLVDPAATPKRFATVPCPATNWCRGWRSVS